jgi:dipeptidyl aminopeptidase/acylaminoacyl peptidase
VVPKGTFQAVAALYPPTDLLRLVPPGARDNPIHPVALLLGAKVDQRIDLAKEASPIKHVSGDDPPTLLFHGSSDPIVPVEQSKLLAQKLKAAGVPVRLLITDGGHAFALYPDRVNDILNFLDSVPSLKGMARKSH